MVWACNKKRRRNASERHYGMKRSEEDVVDIAEKVRGARLGWFGHVIRRDEGELVRHCGLKRSKDVGW